MFPKLLRNPEIPELPYLIFVRKVFGTQSWRWFADSFEKQSQFFVSINQSIGSASSSALCALNLC